MSRKFKCFVSILLFFVVIHTPVFSQDLVITPKEFFGSNIGDDYYLANYAQLTEYWKKLEQESDRIKLVEIGKTAEGRTILMAIITSPENHKNLDHFKTIIPTDLSHVPSWLDGNIVSLSLDSPHLF